MCKKRGGFILSRALIVLDWEGGARGEVDLTALCHALELKECDELGEKKGNIEAKVLYIAVNNFKVGRFLRRKDRSAC